MPPEPARKLPLPLLGAAILAAVGVFVYLGGPEPTALKEPTPEELTTPEPVQVLPPSASDEPASPTKPVAQATPLPPGMVITREIPNNDGGPPLIPGLVLQQGELAYEKRIREITSDPNTQDADKARRLFEILPTLPVEGREAAAEEAIKLIRDRDYRIAEPLVINPATYGPAMEMLWIDLMTRPDEITLPTLMRIVRNPSHPYATNAKENLELLLGKDYGTDWAKWEAAVSEHLAKK